MIISTQNEKILICMTKVRYKYDKNTNYKVGSNLKEVRETNYYAKGGIYCFI